LKRVEEVRRLRDRFTDSRNRAMKDPDSADLRYELGVLARQLDKPLLAASWFQRARALQPGHEKAQRALRDLAEAAEQGGLRSTKAP
jgi:hypothetical protein